MNYCSAFYHLNIMVHDFPPHNKKNGEEPLLGVACLAWDSLALPSVPYVGALIGGPLPLLLCESETDTEYNLGIAMCSSLAV